MDTKQRLENLAVSDTGFVFDPFSGSTFSVNDAGLLILESLKRGAGRAEILTALHERFEIADEDLDRDVDEFVGLLKKNGLVQPEMEI